MFKRLLSADIRHQRYAWAVGVGVFLFLLGFSPGTLAGAGYTLENLSAAQQLLTSLGQLITQGMWPGVAWPRHGAPELLLELPFLLPSRLLFGTSTEWAGGIMILQPALAVSAVAAIIFLWTHRLTGNFFWAYLISAGGTLGTMLWPYAYIGMETSQSACLLGAAYLALAQSGPRSWKRTILFALCAGFGLSVKSNGIFLLPAIGYLAFHFLHDAHDMRSRVRQQAVLIASVVAAIFALGYLTRQAYWAAIPGGNPGYFASLLVNSPVTAFFNFYNFFASPNKGLFFYSPLMLWSLVKMPAAYRTHRVLVIFALLVLLGLAGGFSLVEVWTDETWGPRYLHSAVGPLLISLAATGSRGAFHRRPEAGWIACALLGTAVSFLGVFFSYSVLHQAMIGATQQTLSAMQHAPEWNHIRFNGKLFMIWAGERIDRSPGPVKWPPEPYWMFEKPADAPAVKTVDLRELADPQPLPARQWKGPNGAPAVVRILRPILMLCLAAGLILLATLARMTYREKT